jgi:hypothetical protein
LSRWNRDAVWPLFPDDRPTVGTPDDVAQGPSTVRTPVENKGTVMAESGSPRVGARRPVLRLSHHSTLVFSALFARQLR